MKAQVYRRVVIGVLCYLGFTYAGYLATSGRVMLAYGVLFVVCFLAAAIDRVIDQREVNK